MPEHLTKYVEYIRNTKRVPLPIAHFDDDWVPIGPMVRSQLVAAGLIVESADGITLREQDPARGLYNKFTVTRTDGRSAPGQKHDGCAYFVLDLTHDRHAAPALRAYADSCEAEYPALARDLRAEAIYAGARLPVRRGNRGLAEDV